MMKLKRAAVLLAATLLTLLAVGAQAFELTGLETESVSREWESSLFFSRMEALTGIPVQAQAVYEEEEYQKLLAGMAKGDVTTDALFKANLTRTQERELLEAGALIDLAPLIDQYMPNLSALLAEHPEWREIMTLEDGRIASLPLLNDRERQVCVWINKAWLDTLGLDMPTTLGELTAVLAAFRDGDLNLNFKADEVALDMLGVWELRWLLPYFGIVADDYNIARVDGAAVFAPELPAYRDFVAQLADWYQQGLLLPEAFTDVHSSSLYDTSEDETVTSGLLLSLTPYTHVSADAMTDYVPLLIAGPDGEIVWRDLLGAVWTGAFAVTSACENPGEALAWADALYAQEGMLLAYAGVEGENYTVSGDGTWSFITDLAYTVENLRAEVLMYTGTTMPGLVPNDFLARVSSEQDRHIIAASEQVRAVAKQVTQPYALTDAQQARANELALQIGALVDTGIARFATGETALTDENWNAWLAQLRQAGSEEMTELFGAVQ